MTTPEEQAAIDAVAARWEALRAREKPLRAVWSESPRTILSLEEFCVDRLGKRSPMPWEAVISDDTLGAAKQWEYDFQAAEEMVEQYAAYLDSPR